MCVGGRRNRARCARMGRAPPGADAVPGCRPEVRAGAAPCRAATALRSRHGLRQRPRRGDADMSRDRDASSVLRDELDRVHTFGSAALMTVAWEIARLALTPIV